MKTDNYVNILNFYEEVGYEEFERIINATKDKYNGFDGIHNEVFQRAINSSQFNVSGFIKELYEEDKGLAYWSIKQHKIYKMIKDYFYSKNNAKYQKK